MIPDSHWDVLVVGAGPAGSRAAAASALSGARTLLLDAKRNIGERPHCGEYVHEGLFEQFGLDESSTVSIVTAIQASVMDLDADEPKNFSGSWLLSDGLAQGHNREALAAAIDDLKPLWRHGLAAGGRMIDRTRFDRDLARKAASCGATVVSSARFVRRVGSAWAVKWKDRELLLESRCVVAADGALSAAASALGMDRLGLAVGIQVEVPLVPAADEIRLFFSRDFFGGYGWLFPKGKSANVGVLVAQQKGIRPAALLNKLLRRLEIMGIIRRGILATHRGVIPVSGIRPSLVKENVIFCGDAGGFAHPVTGAGIAHAVISGDHAGRAAAQAAETGSLEPAREYEVAMKMLFGSMFSEAVEQREQVISRWGDAGFERLVKSAWFAHGVSQPSELTLSSYLRGINGPVPE